TTSGSETSTRAGAGGSSSTSSAPPLSQSTWTQPTAVATSASTSAPDDLGDEPARSLAGLARVGSAVAGVPVGEQGGVARAGRTGAALPRRAPHSPRLVAREDEGAVGAEREDALLDAERAERLLARAAAELDRLSLVQLESAHVGEHAAVELAVDDERALPA